MTSEIPIRKTGLVVFSSRIVSVFTGIGLPRADDPLSITQFDLWEV